MNPEDCSIATRWNNIMNAKDLLERLLLHLHRFPIICSIVKFIPAVYSG